MDLEKYTGAGIILAQNIMRDIIPLAKTDEKLWILASNLNKILCLITFCYEIFLLSSQFQWDFWQKNEQVSHNLPRK